MFCVKCGMEISDEAKFCPFCGNVVQEKPMVQPEAGMPNVPQAEVVQPEAGMPSVPQAEVVQPEAGMPVPPMQPLAGNGSPAISEKEQRKLEKKRRKQEIHQAVFCPKQMKPGASVMLSLLFGILMLCFLTLSACSLIMQYTVKSNALFEAVNKADFNRIAVTDMFPADKLADVGIEILPEGDNTIYDVLSRESREFIDKQIPKELSEAGVELDIPVVTPETWESIVEQTGWKALFAVTVNHYAEYFLTGTAGNAISSKQLGSLIEQTADIYTEYTGYTIEKEIMPQLEDKVSVDVLNPEKVLQGNTLASVSAILFSPAATVLYIVLSVSTALVLALITRRLRMSMRVLGICTAILGTALLFVSALTKLVFPSNYFYQLLVDAASQTCVFSGLILWIFTLVMFLIIVMIRLFGKGGREHESQEA